MDENYAEYLLNKTVSDYNSIAEKYSRVREKEWREMGFLFDKNLKTGDAVLDFGCGNGRFYPAFKKRGVDYHGVDPSSRLVEMAKTGNPSGNFMEVPIGKLPFPDDHFDEVYSIAVLHHIPSRRYRLKMLEEAKRILRSGSYLILTVWNLKEKIKPRGFFGWLKSMRLEKGDVMLPWYGSKDTYFHCFNLEELVQLVKDSGFDVVEKGEILVGERPYSNFYIVAKK